MKIVSIFLFFFLFIKVFSLENDKKENDLSIIFIGDIMGHSTLIQSALEPKSGNYDFEDIFKPISAIIDSADFAIANLEVTLAGRPYKGYPKFSSPDELAVACKNNGINVLVTANNHACDSGKEGILRTIQVLDSLQIQHTGTFKDSMDRKNNNLLILNKNNIKIGLLNYTYSTNGIPMPESTIVNIIDTLLMLSDIKKSKKDSIDKLIVMMHWGDEYQSHPSEEQKKVAEFLFQNGVDIIVGTHPHVLQKMEYQPKDENKKERFIAYSLGNFISNQRRRKRDGGAMLKLTLKKINEETCISHQGYYLIWVYKFKKEGRQKFKILPCSRYESNGFKNLDIQSKERMKLFISDSRDLFGKENLSVKEIKENVHKNYMINF